MAALMAAIILLLFSTKSKVSKIIPKVIDKSFVKWYIRSTKSDEG